MALCASGEMSLGGSTTGRSVNLELDRAATASINMNETAVRTLAGRASGAICMQNFYGKSSFPGLGGELDGGFYMGTISAAGTSYYIIMAPNATGCAACQWKTTHTFTGVGPQVNNGFASTYNCLANATHPAGNFTATRSIGGFSDWYLPAKNELNQIYLNIACAPAGQKVHTNWNWQSTESCVNFPNDACVQRFGGFGMGGSANNTKSSILRLRAIRRCPF